MSAKQIRFFGTAAQKAALKRRKKRSNAANFSNHRKRTVPRAAKPRVHRRTRRRAVARVRRVNVAGIIGAGLPFLNPARKRRKKTAMAKSTHRRRRVSAKKHRSTRRRTNPKIVVRYRTRKAKAYSRKRRMNPRGSSAGSLLSNGAYAAVGAVGSRALSQMLLGSGNTGIMGYGANVASTLALGWAAGKFLGRNARTWVVGGGMAGLVLRLIQDYTPYGKYFSLSGAGDPGMGILMPSSFVDPALFTGSGAQRAIPSAWRPAPVAAPAKAGMSGLGASSYGYSTYR